MKKVFNNVALALSIAVALQGCASTSKKAAAEKKQPTLTAEVAPHTGQAPRSATTFVPVEQPVPVYVNPQIISVYMGEYQNERGEFVFPGEKKVMRRPGHWNMEAAQNPDRSYIPQENLSPIPGSESWTNLMMPGSPKTPEQQAGGVITERGSTALRTLASPRDIRVLKIVDRAQEAAARALIVKGEILVWDEAVGYIAVPQETLYNTPVSVPGLREEIRIEKASPASSGKPDSGPVENDAVK